MGSLLWVALLLAAVYTEAADESMQFSVSKPPQEIGLLGAVKIKSESVQASEEVDYFFDAKKNNQGPWNIGHGAGGELGEDTEEFDKDQTRIRYDYRMRSPPPQLGKKVTSHPPRPR